MQFIPDADNLGEIYRDSQGARYARFPDGSIGFGDVARILCLQQSQYASRYVDGVISGYPALGKDLRFTGKPGEYHSLRVHPDDVEEFITRYDAYSAVRHGTIVEHSVGRRDATTMEIELGRKYLQVTLGLVV